MKPNFRDIVRRAKKYHLVTLLCGLALAIVLAAETLILFFFRTAERPLVIHYTKNGIDQFGGVWQIAGYGLVGCGIVIVNYLIALELEERDWLWGKVVAGLTLLLAILLFVAFQAIISVN